MAARDERGSRKTGRREGFSCFEVKPVSALSRTTAPSAQQVAIALVGKVSGEDQDAATRPWALSRFTTRTSRSPSPRRAIEPVGRVFARVRAAARRLDRKKSLPVFPPVSRPTGFRLGDCHLWPCHKRMQRSSVACRTERTGAIVASVWGGREG